jgi:predicted phosphodiesterase
MRIAIFSDIHGNTPGLRAVLAAIEKAGGADLTVAAGDLVAGGPGTEEIFDLLLAHGVTILRGNWRDFAWRSAEWLWARIAQPYLDLVAGLPQTLRLEPVPGHRLTICHAAPDNVWSNTCAAQNDPALLRAVYGGEDAEVIAYGHYHAHHTLWLDDKLLVNVAGVSTARRGLSAYSLIQYAGFWQVQQYQVPYDAGEEQRLRDAYQPPPY